MATDLPVGPPGGETEPLVRGRTRGGGTSLGYRLPPGGETPPGGEWRGDFGSIKRRKRLVILVTLAGPAPGGGGTKLGGPYPPFYSAPAKLWMYRAGARP